MKYLEIEKALTNYGTGQESSSVAWQIACWFLHHAGNSLISEYLTGVNWRSFTSCVVSNRQLFSSTAFFEHSNCL